MPEFICRLGAPNGMLLEQRRIAASQESLQRELEQEGFHVFSLTRPRLRLTIPVLGRQEKVSGQEFLLFNTQLRTLLKAGMPLTQSLELLKDQLADRILHKADRMEVNEIESSIRKMWAALGDEVDWTVD